MGHMTERESMDVSSQSAETIQQILQRKRANLVAKLAELDAAIAAVAAQPGLIDAVNALRKVGI